MGGGTKTKIYRQGTVCRWYVLVALRSVKLGLSLEIKQNHWVILKKSSISNQFRADVKSTPRYTADNEWCVRSKMPGFCLMVAAASAIRAIGSSSESTSHYHLQRMLHWTGRTYGLASQVIGPHPNGLLPMGPQQPLIYTSPVDSEEDFIARIVEAAATIRQQPSIFERSRQSPLHRCPLCIEVGDRTCEHLL